MQINRSFVILSILIHPVELDLITFEFLYLVNYAWLKTTIIHKQVLIA